MVACIVVLALRWHTTTLHNVKVLFITTAVVQSSITNRARNRINSGIGRRVRQLVAQFTELRARRLLRQVIFVLKRCVLLVSFLAF